MSSSYIKDKMNKNWRESIPETEEEIASSMLGDISTVSTDQQVDGPPRVKNKMNELDSENIRKYTEQIDSFMIGEQQDSSSIVSTNKLAGVPLQLRNKMRESSRELIRECEEQIESLSFGAPEESIIIVPSDQLVDGTIHDRCLGKDTLSVRMKSNIMSSPSSLHSKSTIYPSPYLTLKETFVHFANALTTIKAKLVPHSVAALRIGHEIKGRFAYDDVSKEWYAFDLYRWRCCSRNEVDNFVTYLMYAGTGDVGFGLNYMIGVVNLIQKTGQNRLPRRRPGVIPFRNGLFNPETRILTPTTPENADTWAISHDYSLSVGCPNFIAWIRIAVDDDIDTIRLLQAWINALLTGRADLQVFLHLFGPAGTGKSTFGRLMFAIVGDENATTTSLQQLEKNSFENANIHGKQLVVIAETDKYGGSVGVLKAMTGQDQLRLERKYQQQQGSFIYGGQTLVMSNERFTTTDYTGGIERRRMTVEFKRPVTKKERAAWSARGGEQEILFSEVTGIINWALSLDRDQVTAIFQAYPERVQKANLEAARFNNPVNQAANGGVRLYQTLNEIVST